MTAEQLAHMMDSWSDALNLMELVGSRFLRVTDRWDLHEWQAVDLPDGIHFQRRDASGELVEEVVVTEAVGRPFGPARINAAVPTWMIEVGPEQQTAREEAQPVI
jgi:hypothetical protein